MKSVQSIVSEGVNFYHRKPKKQLPLRHHSKRGSQKIIKERYYLNLLDYNFICLFHYNLPSLVALSNDVDA